MKSTIEAQRWRLRRAGVHRARRQEAMRAVTDVAEAVIRALK